jgi:ACS family hexuronate transporter-like MFS transporter
LIPNRYRTVRWWIVGLLFLATTINYIDRQTLSVLSTTLREELNLTDRDYANCVSAFLVSYAIMYSVSGRIIDRVGVRLGASVCVVWWSIATALTGLARGPLSLMFFRFLLGIGEPGIFPAGMKACGEWFPRKLRGTAIGIFSSGSAIGAVVAAPLLVFITHHWGWRTAFVIPGLVGLVIWLPLWWLIYRSPSATVISNEDLSDLAADTNPEKQRSWFSLLRERNVWGLVLGRIGADPVWYLYLFWLPDYLQRARGLTLIEVGMYVWIPFLFADLGSMFGGMISDRLIRRGMAAPRARYAVLAGIAVLAPLGALVGVVESVQASVGIACLIAFLCQAWSINMATLVPDLTAKNEIASVMGLLGTSGSVGGIIFAQVLGVTIAAFGFTSAFAMAALLHPISAVVLFFMLRPILKKDPT